MNRPVFTHEFANGGVPHMRGDEPYQMDTYLQNTESSPHAWG